MRRWLVAVLALHFLVSVGAFAFGSPANPVAARAAAPVAQSLLMGEQAIQPTAADQADGQRLANAQLADHGLGDDQPDLPECLDVPLAMSSRGAHWRTPSPPLAKDLTPPVLDGLQRPPRGLPAFA